VAAVLLVLGHGGHCVTCFGTQWSLCYLFWDTVTTVLLVLGHGGQCVTCFGTQWPLSYLFWDTVATVLHVLRHGGHCVACFETQSEKARGYNWNLIPVDFQFLWPRILDTRYLRMFNTHKVN
jgi:hypothetical protein